MGLRLFVSNLPFDVNEREIRTFFGDGEECHVKSVRLIKDHVTNNFRGFCFVEVSSEREVEEAIQDLHEADLGGRKVRVVRAKDQQPSTQRSNKNA